MSMNRRRPLPPTERVSGERPQVEQLVAVRTEEFITEPHEHGSTVVRSPELSRSYAKDGLYMPAKALCR